MLVGGTDRLHFPICPNAAMICIGSPWLKREEAASLAQQPKKKGIVMGSRGTDRKDRLIKERRHDNYQAQGKWKEPTLCTECGALFAKGRWAWKKRPKQANPATCPACRRIAGNYPAGYLDISGGFFEKNQDEILNLVRNTEEQEKRLHPLERIIAIRGGEDHTLVTTTGIHIARRIGEALSRSYKGTFSFQYGDGEQSIRASWQRDS